MSTEACRICGTERQTRTMETACGTAGRRTLDVCEDCLSRRDTRRWDAEGAEGRRLLEALAGGDHAHPQGRYSYLVDPREAVHLVRLEHRWLDRHAAHA